MLANGINFPIVCGLGLVTFLPLTLLVSAIESHVFNRRLATGFRPVFRHVFGANLMSTLAGAMLLLGQDSIVRWSGITESIPTFVRGYRWVAPLLVLGYLAKSVLIETLYMTQRSVRSAVPRPAGAMFRAVLVRNLCSYLLVGPLFYFSTRPHFGGLETTFDARWSANAGEVVYYLDPQNHSIRRKQLGSPASEVLVPYPTRAFLVSEDESTIAYFEVDERLYVYRTRENRSIRTPRARGFCLAAMVTISPDNRRIAYVEPPTDRDYPSTSGGQFRVFTFDLESLQRAEVDSLPANDLCQIVWSADGTSLFALGEREFTRNAQGSLAPPSRPIHVFEADPPFGLRESREVPSALAELVVSFGRFREDLYGWDTGYAHGSQRSRVGDYTLLVYPYLGSFLRVNRGEESVLLIQNAYGLLNLGGPAVTAATPLREGDEVLLDWGDQTYVLSIPQRRLGLAAAGDHAVMRTSAFRLSFGAEGE